MELSALTAASKRGWTFQNLRETQVHFYARILERLEESEKKCRACPGLAPRPSRNGTWYVPPSAEEAGGRCDGERPEVSYDGQTLLEKGRPCELREAADAEAAYAELLRGASIPGGTDHMTLANFKAARGTKAAHQAACDFAEGRSERGIIFAGPTGCGKTHLAIGILRHRLMRRQLGVFRTVPELLDTLRAAQRSDDNRADKIMELLKTTPLLCFDDFGTEKGTDWAAERLFIIINARELNGGSLLATTNFPKPKDLAERLGGISGERIVSRMRGLCSWVQMDAPDYRGRPVGKDDGKGQDPGHPGGGLPA